MLPLHQSAINFYTSKNYFGDPDRIRTCDLRFRKPLLYPAELPGRARHYSPKALIRSRALCFALLALLWPGLGLAQTCPRPEQNAGPAAKVHSRREIELQDGRLIRAPHLAPFEASARGSSRMALSVPADNAEERDET